MSFLLRLDPTCVLLGHGATSLADVVGAAAPALAARCSADASAIKSSLTAAVAESDFALGSGIAIPHVAVPGLAQRAVAFVRSARPLPLRTVDGTPVDLFFVVIYPPGAHSDHLRFLAHVASLCRSRVVRDGLRAAESVADVLGLIDAGEARLVGVQSVPPTSGARALAIIAVSGERATDTIVLGLIREELAAATIVDAQTLEKAASREVPLFAGFRDLFGDPAGRRIILAPIDMERTQALAAIVKSACEDDRAASAEVFVLPIATYHAWGLRPTARAGHE